MATEKSSRTGGATSWPRMDPRPQPLSWFDWLFDVVLQFTRPVLQVVFFVNFVYPYWLPFAKYFLETLGMSERFFFAFCTVGTHHTMWAIMNGFFLFVEQYGWLERFHLPCPDASRPSYALKKEAIFGSLIGGIPMFIGSYVGFTIYKYFGTPHPLSPLPSIFDMWKTLAMIKLGSGLLFDLSHRLIHSKQLYSKVHSMHHRFIATMSIAAEFAHPIEGAGPIIVPMVLGLHPLFWCIFLCWEQFNSAITHSGYCFYITDGKLAKALGFGFLAEEAAYHHHHHFRNKGNFSSPMWDHLWGTQDDWLHVGGLPGYIESLKLQEEKRKQKLKTK